VCLQKPLKLSFDACYSGRWRWTPRSTRKFNCFTVNNRLVSVFKTTTSLHHNLLHFQTQAVEQPVYLCVATCNRCGNCGTRSSTPLCPRCIQLSACRYCKRHLPGNFFDYDSDNVCWACRNKQQKENTRQVCNELVSEIEVATDQHDRSFGAFLSRNEQHIQSVIEDYRHRLR